MVLFNKTLDDFAEAVPIDPRESYGHTLEDWIWATCPKARFRDVDTPHS